MKTNINRREFSKLSLLTGGGLLLTPFEALSIAIILQNNKEETPYSIKNSSYTVGRMIQRQKLYTPIEYKIDLSDATSSSDLNRMINTKATGLAQTSFVQSQKYSLFGPIGDSIQNIPNKWKVGIIVGALTYFSPKTVLKAIPGFLNSLAYDMLKNTILNGDPTDFNGDMLTTEKFKETINELETTIWDTHADSIGELNTIREKVEDTIKKQIAYLDLVLQDDMVRQEIKLDDILEKFEPLYQSTASIEELIKHESANNRKDFREVKGSIERLNTPLREIKENLSSNSEKLDIINQDIWKASDKVIDTLSRKIVISKEELLKQSREMQDVLGGKVDIVGKYIFLNLPPKYQLQALEARDLQYVKELEQREFDKLRSEAEKKIVFREKQERYQILENKIYNANKILGETYEAALALGLKGEAAEKAGIVVDSAGQLSAIALSFASANPIGIISGALQSIGFLGRLFNRKRGYDPTLKALNQIGSQLGDMYKSMNEGFQHIDNKIGNLAKINIEMYNSLMEGIEKQMQYQEDWFIHLDKNQKNIISNQQLISKQIMDLNESTYKGFQYIDDKLNKLAELNIKMYNSLMKGINEGFQHIDNKINSLAEINTKLYGAMMKGIEQQTQFQQEWFGYLAENHEYLRNNQQKILLRTEHIIKLNIEESEKDIGILFKHEENRKNGKYENPFLETFEDYKIMYDLPKFNDGLDALYSFVSNISNENMSYFSLLTNSSDDISLAYYEEIEIYKPSRDIFNDIYSNNNFTKSALNSLLLPVAEIKDSDKAYELSEAVNTDSVFYQVRELDSVYLSTQSIVELSDLYIKYVHYFEFYKNGNTFEPSTMEEYLALDDISKKNRIADIISNLDNLIDVTNRAIAQQSVMSGHLVLQQIDFAIFGVSRPELRPKIIKAINSNYILAHNFIKYFLHPKLHKLSLADRTASAMSEIIGHNVTKGKGDKLIVNINDELSITMPSLEEIEANEMSYPADLYVLLDTKQKLIAKRMDMEFGGIFDGVG